MNDVDFEECIIIALQYGRVNLAARLAADIDEVAVREGWFQLIADVMIERQESGNTSNQKENNMDTDYSKQGLLDFIQYAADKGLVNGSSARMWRVAVSKLLVDLAPTEEADVRIIDVDVITRKFANRHPSALTPESLYTYRYRLTAAIQEFVAWTNDPVGYKPKGTNRKTLSTELKGKPAKHHNDKKPYRNDGVVADGHSEEHAAVSHGLPLPYPIRPDFLGQVVIPRDLTMDEARRIYAFLQTLTVDFQPSERVTY
jgi:hypothetical protein